MTGDWFTKTCPGVSPQESAVGSADLGARVTVCAPPVAPAFHPHTVRDRHIRERARYIGADRAPIGYSCWAGLTTVNRLKQAAQAVLLHTAPHCTAPTAAGSSPRSSASLPDPALEGQAL